MELHKSLYKEQRSQTPHHKRVNRELQVANRNKQRRDRFQNSRNISPSPVEPKEIIIPLISEDKENASQKENPDSTRLAKLVCNANNPEKLSKQEAFLKRFVEWRYNKKNMKQQQQEASKKKKPFVSAVSNGSRQTATSSALVPRGHHKEFRPPVGLKNPIVEKVELNNKSIVKGRQSIYTVVPTPPRKPKQVEEKPKKSFPIARKALPTNLHIKILNSNKTLNSATSSLKRTGSKPSTTKLNNKTPVDNQKPTTLRKNTAINPTFETKTTTSTTATAVVVQPVVRSNLRPRALKMPPPPPPKLASKNFEEKKLETAAARQTGAAAKIRAMTSKRPENAKPTKRSPSKIGGARLAQNLKAKKLLNNSKNISVPSIQVNSKNIKNLFKNNEAVIEDMVLQTPKDFSLNPFEEFVTSTKLRNSGHNMKNLQDEDISPIESLPKRFNEVKKFNFMRYSEAPVVNDDENINHKDNDNKEERMENGNRRWVEEDKTLVNDPITIDEKTPTKTAPEEKPANYLSPFVSVSRGKVSLKKEKEKRNSIYLQNGGDNNDEVPAGVTSPKGSPKCSVEVRRILEAVRYFRKQLQNEIDRLHQLCDVWEAYKSENLEKIQNVNGEDMINVTIGQTRLLTSKKFMQFKGLIDRCESGATGIGALEYDGSEDTKPITSVDLEGFWSMLGLQVDNLDKRFDNLNRWKQNDWLDPDEVRPKIKKNLTKVKKVKAAPAAKARPNSALQQMLRKMQAEMRKNKNKGSEDECAGGDVLTPSKRRRSTNNSSSARKSTDNSSSRRLSIVVKDRKYFSPAATVISVSSPIMQRKSSQDSLKLAKHVQKFNEALDDMQSSFDLRKSVLINGSSRRMSFNPQSPLMTAKDKEELATSSRMSLSSQPPQHSPVPAGRKSILKTPGTAKSKQRNVIFNEKLRVKKFNFLINEDDPLNAENGAVQNANESHEENLANKEEEENPKRTLTLRNRKVRLRPSCEIVIPLK